MFGLAPTPAVDAKPKPNTSKARPAPTANRRFIAPPWSQQRVSSRRGAPPRIARTAAPILCDARVATRYPPESRCGKSALRGLRIPHTDDRYTLNQGEVLTTQPSQKPGWYPDPTGRAELAYWNGQTWGSPPSKPSNKQGLVIGGSIVGGFALLGLIGNVGSSGDSVNTTASTLTKTVTVAAQPTTVTETAPPSISTVTITQAAPPASFFEPPAPVYEPPEAPPLVPEPPPPPVAPLVPQVPSSAYYGNCAAARAAGAAPLHVGEPGYRSGLDRDGDGVACE